MGSRPPLGSPFQFTFGSPSWRFQIQQGNNQQILLSQWLQGQSSQTERNQIQPSQVQPSTASNTSDVAVNITPGTNDAVWNGQQSQANEEQTNTSPRPSPTANAPNSPFSAISLFLEQNPEMYGFVQQFLAYIPFLILVIIKEIYTHTSDILVILALVITFIHADKTVQREVAKQGKRDVKPLAVIPFNIAACIALVHFLCGDNEIYHSLLVFTPSPAPLSITNLIWAVTTTDHILKLITVLLKTILTLIPVGIFPVSRRGKCFVFIERSSHLYRALAAVPPWIHYLINSRSSEGSSVYFYDTLVGVCLCGIYLTCKAYGAIQLVTKWKTSFSKLLQSTNYGSSPSIEQLQAAGLMCPICHDEYRKPTFLSCKHIFCEDCLTIWLDRERTCPMCRSTVAEDPQWKDGSTSYLVQFF